MNTVGMLAKIRRMYFREKIPHLQVGIQMCQRLDARQRSMQQALRVQQVAATRSPSELRFDAQIIRIARPQRADRVADFEVHRFQRERNV
jgi:hypothetical protein